MLGHHIQRDILYKLVTSPSAKFGELRPKNIDSNIFTYHLHQLITQKLVLKRPDGSYGLTAAGKAVGTTLDFSAQELLEQAHSVLLIVARNDKGEWLLRRRLAHPVYGKLGFVHSEPHAHETLEQSANRGLKNRTGLTADYQPIGAGYVKIYKDDALESFTHFTALEASNFKGKFLEKVGNGQNLWLAEPDFNSPDMIPSMADIVQQINSDQVFFFAHLTYSLD